MSIQYSMVTWQTHQSALMYVRELVFINEQNVPKEIELDEYDANCVHIIAIDSNHPEYPAIATARLLAGGHIGRMCVLKQYRNQSIGSQMLKQLIDYAKSKDFKSIQLNAQVSAIEFYQKHGFSINSEVFLEAGIEHRAMILK